MVVQRRKGERATTRNPQGVSEEEYHYFVGSQDLLCDRSASFIGK